MTDSTTRETVCSFDVSCTYRSTCTCTCSKRNKVTCTSTIYLHPSCHVSVSPLALHFALSPLWFAPHCLLFGSHSCVMALMGACMGPCIMGLPPFHVRCPMWRCVQPVTCVSTVVCVLCRVMCAITAVWSCVYCTVYLYTVCVC